MTAVPNWDLAGPNGSDAELARASAAGDRRAFAEIYDRYADRLHDYCVGMLRDRDGAADCVQDTFCIAATRLPQLRDPDKLRPWLYSIARNEALRRIRERRREEPSDEVPDTASAEPGPDTLAARTELADLIADAAGGLSDRDRSVLELAFRHGLDGPELADALGVSPASANTLVHRLRGTIERSLGALLVSRRVRNGGGCAELAAILDGWDGHFNVLMRKRISRHIESCETCDEERRRLVSPVALLGAAPVFIPAPEWLRERTLSEVQLTSASASMSDSPHDHVDSASGRDSRGFILPVAAFIAALVAASALIFIWLNQKDVAITPTEASSTVPASSAPPPPPSIPPPPPPPSVTTTVPATAPPARTSVVQTLPPTSPPAPPPISEPPPPPPEVTPEVPPPAPPPAWPDWLPPLPPWPPPPPPQPPPGGDSTPRLVIDPPPPSPPPGSSVRP